MVKINGFDVDDIFAPWGERKPGAGASKRSDYDVNITVNKGSKGEKRIRFSFLNKGLAAINGRKYGEVSHPACTDGVLYFRFHNEKTSANVHTFSYSCTSDQVTQSKSRYIYVRPANDVESKLFEEGWVNKTYNIKYDSSSGLYYIRKKDA